MDISKIKDVILSVFKTHSSLLVPVVIGLVAVLLFIPSLLMSSKLKGQVSRESITNRGGRIGLLSRSAVAREQWKEEQVYQQEHKKDANAIDDLAMQSTQRELLSYTIFPAPKDRSQFIFEQFGQQFRSALDKLLDRIKAGECPSKADFEKSLQSSLGSDSSNRFDEVMGVPYGRLGGARAEIQDALCRARAESASIYANPVNLGGYEFWGNYEYKGMDEAIKDCWYYQLAYWIIEDVIDTIETMNTDSDSVLASPVKRLLGVMFTFTDEFSRGDYSSVMASGRYPGREVVPGGKPSYVLSVRDGLTNPWTRRMCNDDIDVMHFNVRVVVSSKEILPFMRQLCSAKQHKFKGFFNEGQEQIFKHNQITILESKIGLVAQGRVEGAAAYEGTGVLFEYREGSSPYDENRGMHDLYRYGEDAVVELELICEYIFNKKGYDEIKPELVNKGESKTTSSR
ncbi:MAG: hypothetical protein ACYS6W_05480 [Planctomycetota bacterium]|jgi:hypothetical protein